MRVNEWLVQRLRSRPKLPGDLVLGELHLIDNDYMISSSRDYRYTALVLRCQTRKTLLHPRFSANRSTNSAAPLKLPDQSHFFHASTSMIPIEHPTSF